MKKVKRIILWLSAIPIVLIAGMAWLLWGGISNPAGRKTIGEITPPMGFQRVEVEPGSFGAYLREFPLQGRGSHMKYFDGSLAHGQYLGYAVLDLPMIQYRGGADHEALHKYLRKVYGASNTSTLRHELKKKPFAEIAPGDVLVYEADGRHSVGHAVLVVDVAVNPHDGRKALLVAESSMPALTMHIVRNLLHPLKSPWIIVEESDEDIIISVVRFRKNDLRGWG